MFSIFSKLIQKFHTDPAISQADIRLLQSQTVIIYMNDGRTVQTYLRTALIYIGKLEIMKEECITFLKNSPDTRNKILNDQKNYEFVPIEEVFKVETSAYQL